MSGTETLATRTPWSRGVSGRLVRYMRTETASSSVLLAAIVVAVVWASVTPAYETFWRLRLSLSVADLTFGMELREWVGRGLMTLFFLVVGVEARRQFDLGELRERTYLVIPLLAGITAMALPVLVFVVVNANGAVGGWGAAMSTDTALALGLLALVGRRVPERLRAFVVTVFIVDDLVALVVIAIVYSRHIRLDAIAIAVVAFLAIPAMRRWANPPGAAYGVAGLICWGGLLVGGVDPVVAGLAIGLAAPAYSPARTTLEQASGLFRRFREQPTPALARSASAGLIGAISPNDRLQTRYHAATSFLVVPLFALANAGVAVSGATLATALRSPITIGIVLAYVIGKPAGVLLASSAVTVLSRGRLRPPIGWGAVTGGGTIAGAGFTVAVLIASLAFAGSDLASAKIGILLAALLSSAVTWAVFRAVALLPQAMRNRLLNGSPAQISDLARPVDPERDHIRGPEDATLTVVEYGDFQCPYCGRAERSVRELRANADVRFVWRHLPLSDVHPRAERAAEAAEAAGAQGAFWKMHDLLLANQDELDDEHLIGYATALGLDLPRFERDLNDPALPLRIAEDAEGADASGVSGTPTFFLNGTRHYGAYDFPSLLAAARNARAVAPLVR